MIKFDLSQTFIGSYKNAQLVISPANLKGEDHEESLDNFRKTGGAFALRLSDEQLDFLKASNARSTLKEILPSLKAGWVITIEGLLFEHLSDSERVAILEHEYAHLLSGHSMSNSPGEILAMELEADACAAEICGTDVVRSGMEKLFKLHSRFMRTGVIELDLSEDISESFILTERLKALS